MSITSLKVPARALPLPLLPSLVRPLSLRVILTALPLSSTVFDIVALLVHALPSTFASRSSVFLATASALGIAM